MRLVVSTLAGAALAVVIHTTPASAQLLTFVSATGADGRPCTVQSQPCRTLERAIDATSAGGEIRFLSSLPSQFATIDKSLTVDGASHTMIGAIVIDSATAMVTLRNLSLNGRNTNGYGIVILNAAVVHVENGTVERYVGEGIHLAAGVSTELFVADSVSRDNGAAGLQVAGPTTAKLTVDNSRFERNGGFGISLNGSRAAISRTIASRNYLGIVAAGTANITDSIAADNDVAGFLVESGGDLTLASSVARGNATGLHVGGSSTARISGSVFTNNGTGIDNGGTALSTGDNLIAGNTIDDVNGTPLTPVAAQ